VGGILALISAETDVWRVYVPLTAPLLLTTLFSLSWFMSRDFNYAKDYSLLPLMMLIVIRCQWIAVTWRGKCVWRCHKWSDVDKLIWKFWPAQKTGMYCPHRNITYVNKYKHTTLQEYTLKYPRNQLTNGLTSIFRK